jgi:hypothetical protein
MIKLIAALLLAVLHLSASAMEIDRKLLDERGRQLLDRADEVRTVLIQPAQRGSFVVLLARLPSTAKRGTGFCGAGYEDHLVLLSYDQRYSLQDDFLLQSCLQSIAVDTDGELLNVDEHKQTIGFRWLGKPDQDEHYLLIAGGKFLLSRPLNIQGETYDASCTASAKAALRAELSGPAAADGWRLLDTLLCAPRSVANKAYVAGHAARKVRYQSYSTGDDEEQATDVAVTANIINELLAAGAAWNASVEASPDEIHLSYYPDQACIHSRTLSLVNGKWRVTAIGSACD